METLLKISWSIILFQAILAICHCWFQVFDTVTYSLMQIVCCIMVTVFNVANLMRGSL